MLELLRSSHKSVHARSREMTVLALTTPYILDPTYRTYQLSKFENSGLMVTYKL